MKVVIVGGGWAGSGAAMAAKNAGADEVVVLERTDMLLGTGLVGGIMRNNGRFATCGKTTVSENHLKCKEFAGIASKGYS